MRVIQGFQTADGVIHTSSEAAARHDFQREIQRVFGETPTVAELAIDLDQLSRIIDKAKARDFSVQRSA